MKSPLAILLNNKIIIFDEALRNCSVKNNLTMSTFNNKKGSTFNA
jgi:hypothetical protein